MNLDKSKKFDFGIFAIILTALFLGFILYETTSPYWNDGPPIPTFFIIKRLAWFPICEIICLAAYFSIYKIFNFPKLRNVSKLLLSIFLATNISIIFIFISSDIYRNGGFLFERYTRSFLFVIFLIMAINACSIICFAFWAILSFFSEKIYKQFQLKALK